MWRPSTLQSFRYVNPVQGVGKGKHEWTNVCTSKKSAKGEGVRQEEARPPPAVEGCAFISHGQGMLGRTVTTDVVEGDHVWHTMLMSSLYECM